MKFGKVLQQSMQVSSSQWEQYWVDYKLLKKIIKDCAQIKNEEKLQGSTLTKMKIKPNAKEDNDSIRTSPDEMNFFRTLRSEIKKIADFFIKEQAAYISIVAALEAKFSNLQQHPMPETKTELMKSCVSLYKELLLLENFAVMNFCGISKILKKHDKWTGYATRNKFMRTILMKQPFATYVPLLQMIDRLEHIFMKTTGCSIEQHDTQQYPTTSLRGMTDSSRTSSNNEGEATGSTTSVHDAVVNRSPPLPDEAVSLNCVHALRDDARLFRATESVDVSVDDGEDDGDGDSMEGQDQDIHDSDLVQKQEESSCTNTHREYGSDSGAAAIAMLAMKEGDAVDVDSAGTTRYKRKACSPLASSISSNGKRKMSFTTILN